MALKFCIEKLEDVAEPFREHYVAENGKFYLATQGEHPKVTEFRSTNVTQARELEELRPLKLAFEGLDAAKVRADLTRLTELEKAKPDGRIAELEAALSTERAARTTLQATADASILRTIVGDKFLKTGGRANALDYIVGKARDVFSVENGSVVGKVFDPTRPGEKLTIDGFISAQIKESDFAFLPSQGGGANPRHGGEHRGGRKELVNPTPQELGVHADAIRRGELRVVSTT